MTVAIALGGLLLASSGLAQTAGAESRPGPTGGAAPIVLFEGTTAPIGRGAEPSIVRRRGVRVNIEALRQRGMSAGARISFPLFEDVRLDGLVEEVRRRPGGGFSVMGRLVGEEPSSFSIAVQDDVLLANLKGAGGRRFQVRSLVGGDHEAVEVDDASMAPCAGGMRVDHEDLGSAPELDSLSAGDDGSVIDIMIAYTAAARAAAGGTAAIQALINLAVDETNLAYRESQISTRVRLVHAYETSYVESSDFNSNLTRLTHASDGYLDEVAGLRNQYGADMVSLIINNPQYCGVGWLMTSLSSGFEAYAFSVVHYSCATGYYSFAHELGHNMGCQHDRQAASSALFSYSYGHRFTGLSGSQWRTIMAYSPGVRIARFSNPSVLFDGVSTGVPVGQAGESSNALTINNTAFTVANFRSSRALSAPTGLTPGGSTPQASISVAGSPILLRWEAVAGADRYEVSVSYWSSSSAQWKIDRTLSASANSIAYTPMEGVTHYTWDVRAGNPTAWSPQSPAVFFHVQAPAACTYTVTPSSVSFPASGGYGTLDVATQAGCFWSALSGTNWMRITAGAAGDGPQSVTYSVSVNRKNRSRTGTLRVADQTVTVTQARR